MHCCSLFSLWPDGVKKAVRALDLTPKAWRRKNISLSFFLSPFQNEQVFFQSCPQQPLPAFHGWQIWKQNCPFMYNLWWTVTWDQPSLHPEQNQESVSEETREGWSYPKWLFQFDFCLPSIKCPSTDPLHRCETSHVRLNFFHYTFGDASIRCIRYVFFCLYDICHPLSIICEVYFERQTS